MLNVEKGDKVILKGFTGIKLGVFEVAKATDKSVTILKKDGEKMIFSKKTGKQINVEEGKEKYANSIMDADGSYVAPTRKKTSKKAEKEEKPEKKTTKKAAKKAEPVEEDIEEDDDEFEDDEDEI